MFERRKRNWNITGTQTSNQQEGATHGINWGNEHHVNNDWVPDKSEGAEMEDGWEEEDADLFVPAVESRSRRNPKGQSRQGFSEHETSKITEIAHTSPFYPSLKKRPDFQEQHKKLTIYVTRDLMETMEKLKKDRYIQSYSWLVSEAIHLYLSRTENQVE
ncbi:ribbon-helix-helix domain-containing protein [Brevibacillus invocatus]|uniref:ribbon-helix-helix domain-containing protein n=1 Tax=Brevibacillus invocatus TaxID=173959 RepID=UPI00203BFF68|nr:ribbon-helix-helix domain-containing protein [Brevibacillus invocatus]MCM3081929.1 ribbon-helix-helix domain-containing protein [Brevibacillus invocatus]MCM3432335.1 ribbon-helix-helix domain-containing protein [Brevibacillus invocatus]